MSPLMCCPHLGPFVYLMCHDVTWTRVRCRCAASKTLVHNTCGRGSRLPSFGGLKKYVLKMTDIFKISCHGHGGGETNVFTSSPADPDLHILRFTPTTWTGGKSR